MGLRDVINSIGTDKEIQGAQSMLPDTDDGVFPDMTPQPEPEPETEEPEAEGE